MKFTSRQPQQLQDSNGGIIMSEIPFENIRVNNYCILAIDGSTSNSGLAIMREYDGALLYSMCATRDSSGETPVHYKIRLKQKVTELLRRNRFITQVIYEEPVISNITAVANLFALRTFVEELVIENEPEFNYLKHYEVSNMRWKKLFLAPDKIPQGTANQKKAVRDRLEAGLPFLNKVTQDEIDAIAMGYVICKDIQADNEEGGERLKSKKKAHAFKYNVLFVGAENDDDMLIEFADIYNGPTSILENGVSISEIDGKTKFDNYIYEKMGEDDKVLIIKFSSKHHGNVILQHRIGNLAARYPYIYGIVWRTSRKY